MRTLDTIKYTLCKLDSYGDVVSFYELAAKNDNSARGQARIILNHESNSQDYKLHYYRQRDGQKGTIEI